jgi:hypothetical protein
VEPGCRLGLAAHGRTGPPGRDLGHVHVLQVRVPVQVLRPYPVVWLAGTVE